MSERRLDDIMTNDYAWRLYTQDLLQDGDSLELHAEEHGRYIAERCVIEGGLPLKHLRECVAWLSSLDKEANQEAGGNFSDLETEDFFEAIARRLAHKSARAALNAVKSDTARSLYKYNYSGWLKRYFAEFSDDVISELMQG